MSEYELLKEKLDRTKSINMKDVDNNKIENIDNIKINKRNKSEIRIIDFIKNANNPYFFCTNDVVIKIEYSKNNRRINDCICSLVSNRAKW